MQGTAGRLVPTRISTLCRREKYPVLTGIDYHFLSQRDRNLVSILRYTAVVNSYIINSYIATFSVADFEVFTAV